MTIDRIQIARSLGRWYPPHGAPEGGSEEERDEASAECKPPECSTCRYFEKGRTGGDCLWGPEPMFKNDGDWCAQWNPAFPDPEAP